MISIKIESDGSNRINFECSEKDEYNFLRDHGYEILDKFIQTRIKNIGKMNITTFQDYINFCKSSPKEQLELIEGHTISYQDFGELEAKNAILMSFEATKRLAPNEESIKSLQSLANDMFEEWRSKT
jgi:hypothetical protein